LRAATSLACLLPESGPIRRCRRLPPAYLRIAVDTAHLIPAKRLLDQSGRWRSPLRYTSSTRGSALSSGASAANVSYGSWPCYTARVKPGCRGASATRPL